MKDNMTYKMADSTISFEDPIADSAEYTTVEPDDPPWVPFVEPVPDFQKAHKLWGIWWEIHIYGIGGMFTLVGIYTFASGVILCRSKLNQKSFFVTLNALVTFFAFERAVFMFLDAYNAKSLLHPAVAYIFVSIGLPCMTSSFYLIFVAWIKATKFRSTNSVHKTKTMIIIIVIHFAVSIGLDIAAGFGLEPAYLLILCQLVFVMWSIILSILYFYLFHRVYTSTIINRKALYRLSGVSVHNKSNSLKYESTTPKLTLGSKLILATAILLLLTAALYLGGVFGCYGVDIIFGKEIDPWPWWAYELCVRLSEVAVCCTLSLASTKPIILRLGQKVQNASLKLNRYDVTKTSNGYNNEKSRLASHISSINTSPTGDPQTDFSDIGIEKDVSRDNGANEKKRSNTQENLYV